MLVKEWMTPQPVTVPRKTPVMEAMQLLRKGGYRRLPVVNDGKIVGIVTDRDLKDALPSKANTLSVYELNYLLSKLTVQDVMTQPVLTVHPDDPVENAALMMEEHKVSGLPVVADETVVGIMTITDILRAFVESLGLREGGTRVTINLPDRPGVLADVAEVAPPSNIVAAVTAGVSSGRRELVLRVVGAGAGAFADRLRAKDLDVIDVH